MVVEASMFRFVCNCRDVGLSTMDFWSYHLCIVGKKFGKYLLLRGLAYRENVHSQGIEDDDGTQSCAHLQQSVPMEWWWRPIWIVSSAIIVSRTLFSVFHSAQME